MPNAGYRPEGPHLQIARVTTNDAAKTPIQVIPVPDEGVYQLDLRIFGLRTGGSQGPVKGSACYNRSARITNTGGQVTVFGPETKLTSQDDKTWRVYVEPWSNNVQVSVQGSVGSAVNWTAEARLFVQL